MKNLIMILAAMTALVGHAQSVMASKKYVDTVKSELQAEMMKFPYFDGTPNAMRVSPNPNLGGGFKYVDVNDDNQEMGMAFGPWNASHRAFALWDAGAFDGCDRNDPYFGISVYGLTMPTFNSQYPTWTAPWANLARALNLTDSIDTSRNYPVSSLAVVNYMDRNFPRRIGEWGATGTVYAAFGLYAPGVGFVDYEGVISNTIHEAISAIEKVTFGEWTSDLTMESDGVLLDYVKWDDGVWIIYAKDAVFSGVEIARIAGAEDDTFLTHTDEYGTFTCSRTKDVAYRSPYGILTETTSTNFITGIVTNLLANSVDEAKVTNVVRKVVHATGRYVWDKDLSVCYRFNAQNGFLDLVAVTNIDVTLPENYLALDAIEKEWSNK